VQLYCYNSSIMNGSIYIGFRFRLLSFPTSF
jgi:hypothetical protein